MVWVLGFCCTYLGEYYAVGPRGPRPHIWGGSGWVLNVWDWVLLYLNPLPQRPTADAGVRPVVMGPGEELGRRI